MEVLWWLAPPMVATALAMAWAGWLGRDRDDDRRGDSDAELTSMARALAKPPPSGGRQAAQVQAAREAKLSSAEHGHGVAVRRVPSGKRSPR